MKLINSKLRQARKLLNLTQKQCEDFSGVTQKDISRLESGTREFIPDEYLFFLNEKGIDLNSIFTYNTEVQVKNSLATVKEEVVPYKGCKKCIEKDKKIIELEAQLALMKDLLKQSNDETRRANSA